MDKVVVGLSGGVDSSTAATVLHHQGYGVVGVTLWLMKGKGQCCSEGMVDAAQLCEQLGIPHHIVDSRELFQKNIVDYLVDGYAAGITPLPCSNCNKMVKFAPMLAYAQQELGIEKIATGHYARITQDPTTGRYQLRRAIDLSKDQSYFLYDLSQEVLAATMFPLGEIPKTETRKLAAEFELQTADKPESQDLCLVEAHGSMQTFLDKYIQTKTGDIVDRTGKVLGQHQGVHHYTIGQRKGLGIAAPEPLYVIALDAVNNRVIVGDRTSAGQLECTISRLNWIAIDPPTTPLQAEVQVRYRSGAVPVSIVPIDDGMTERSRSPELSQSGVTERSRSPELSRSGVTERSRSPERVKLIFPEPQFGITPGQAAVFYQGDLVLGGGIIDRYALPELLEAKAGSKAE